jgi:hypothetical protein
MSRSGELRSGSSKATIAAPAAARRSARCASEPLSMATILSGRAGS